MKNLQIALLWYYYFIFFNLQYLIYIKFICTAVWIGIVCLFSIHYFMHSCSFCS